MKDRIKKIMDNNNLSSAQFADKIGVTRSSLSHVLSGRNNASLDYVLKIIQTFPQINSSWLLTGEGIPNDTFAENSSTPPTEQDLSIEKLQSSFSNINKKIAKGNKEFIKGVISDEEENNETLASSEISNYSRKNNHSVELERIVFFYTNGSFKVYSNR